MTPPALAKLADRDDDAYSMRHPGRSEAESRDRAQDIGLHPVNDRGSAPQRGSGRDGGLHATSDDARPTLWRHDRFEADDWSYAGDDQAAAEGPAILPLERFLAERDALVSRNAPLGVVVQPGEPIEDLVPHLGRVALVVLPFPKFGDGRSSSTARLLRERHGFAGEVRAAGDVLIDQMPLMRRCGFDAFEIKNPVTRAQLEAGKWPDVPFYLQPVGSSAQAEVRAGARPWARRPA